MVDLDLYLRSGFVFYAGIFVRSESKFLFICLGGCTQISVYISACVCIVFILAYICWGMTYPRRSLSLHVLSICVIFPHTGS